MDYLPIVVKKGRPFLEGFSKPGVKQRAICPRGKLLSFVNESGHLEVLLLSDDEQRVVIDSTVFVGCQWVLPSRTNQDCVVDQTQQQKSELFVVSSDLDFYWFSVCENEQQQVEEKLAAEEGGLQDGGRRSDTLTIERLALIKKKDLCAELRKQECANVIDSVSILGSDSGQILLLFNSNLVVMVMVDKEFSRIIVNESFVIETSLKPYDREFLPERAAPLVNFVFSSPLLFAVTREGLIFIYHIHTYMCIGIVSTTGYCQYACGRQPDSEELLSAVIASEFKHLAVSSDLNYVVVSTQDSNLLFINLPEYFQVFPKHYHPKFTRRLQKLPSHSSTKSSTIEQEEEEDRKLYGGLFDPYSSDRFVGAYSGQYAWMNRIGYLQSTVSGCNLSDGQHIGFQQSSSLSTQSIVVEEFMKKTTSSLEEDSRTAALEAKTVVESQKQWYEEPITHASMDIDFSSRERFSVPFVTGMQKPVTEMQSSGLQSNLEGLSPSRYYYKNHCILPTAVPLLKADFTVVQLQFASGVIVAYLASKETGGIPSEPHPFVNLRPRIPITGLAVYHTGPQSYSVARLQNPSWLVSCTPAGHVVYLTNQQTLGIATFNLSQEEFVGKVLMYGSASIAEEICLINRWDNCSLPINALETALELRQLDTLAFFLRSREGDAKESDVHQQREEPTDVPYLPPLPPDQLETVVQLLINAIRKNYQEEIFNQFASQLLIMTLGFLTRMIKSQALLEEHAEMRQTSPETEEVGGGPTLRSPRKRTPSGTSADMVTALPEITVSSNDLTSYVHQLRSFLPKSVLINENSRVAQSSGGGPAEGGEDVDAALEFVDKSLAQRWDKLSTKEVIKDALLYSQLPVAQAYLIQRGPDDTGRTKMGGRSYGGIEHGVSLADALDDYPHSQRSTVPHHDACLKSIMTTAIGFVMEALERRSLKLAINILTQIGLNVRASLRHICFHTLNRGLRDFLAKELTLQKWLSDVELQALDYLRILETYYPHQSYDQAHSMHPKEQSSKLLFQSTALPVMPGIVSRLTPIPTVGDLQEIFPETFGGDYPLSRDTSRPPLSPQSSSSLYLQVPLVAVLQWDSSTRQRVLFEGFLLNGMASGVDCERLVNNKEYIFNYYIAHNDITKAIQFLTSEVPPLENPTHCPSNVLSLCSRMPRATTYLHNTLLDELARHGVFLHSELSNLPALLHLLGRVHSVFSHPHPLSKTSSHFQPITEVVEEDGVSKPERNEKALVSLEAFHRGFLQYLIANRFFSLMYHYLDEYGLALDEDSISFLGLDSTDQPWVEVLLQYRRAALNPLDSNVMFQASLSCSHLLLSSGSNGGGRRQVTVMDMLQSGRTLMALATLLLAPVPLEEAMDSKNKHQPWYVEPMALKVAVAAYPSLQAAVFPPPPTTLTPAESQDITVYELLQGSVPFNISRLFKWQGTNNLASAVEETVGSSYDIPHFSAQALIDKSGLAEHLNYIYYLRRGQPSFAFANFVAAKLLGHSNTVKRIDRAMARVYRLTMLDFTNSKLSSSSAAFIEMLDRDSTLLRVDTQVALRIAKHGSGDRSRGGKEDEGSDQHRKLASQFIQLFQNPENTAVANNLLQQLEAATHNLVSINGVEVCGLEAEDYYELVQSFCHCHQLPPSTAFLITCAKHSEWLPLLCHAQRYSISPQKVMMIVEKHFSSPCIQEHLRLAISSMDVREFPSSPTSQASGVFPGGRQKGKRKRTGSSTRTRVRRAETLVRTQRDHRAKYYSRVGLQRETTPQPEVKPSTPQDEEGEEVMEVEVTEEPITTIAEPPVQEREIVFAIEETDLPDDLFSVFFKCQSYETPWRALLAHAIALQRPLLAVLAACRETPDEQDAMIVDCMCVWLYATLGYKVLEKATTLLAIKCDGKPSEDSIRFSADLQWRYWSPFDLSLILMSAMQSTPSPAAALSLVFKYFDPDNPLLKFLLFHEEFVLRRNFDDCRKCLNEFTLALDKALNFRYQFLVGDITWVSQVTSAMASHMLVMCATPFERSHLLQLLSETNFGDNLQSSVLNFRDLHQMSVVLSEAGLASDAAFTVKEHISSMPGLKSLPEIYSVRVRVDTDYVLGLLLEKGQFDIAKKYASIVGSTASQVTIKEVEHNLRKISNSSYWQYEQARLNFWHQCNSSFQTAKVDPESAAEFFESIVHISNEDQPDTHDGEGQQPSSSSSFTCSAMERSLLLAFALKWRKETETLTSDQLREFEKEIWLSHIHSAIEQMEDSSTPRLGSSPLPYLPEVQQSSSVLSMYSRQSSLLSSLTISAAQEYKERRHLGELLLPDNVSVALEGKNRKNLSEKEAEAFDMLLGRLMNAGLLSQARELAALFEHDSPDLTIVLCCIQLAQGKLTPEQLTEGVLSLVSTRPPRHLSDSSYSFEDTSQGRPSAEIIRLMIKLSDRAKYAQQCCDCIMTCFRLALALKVPYAQVITSEPSETLTLLLSSTMPDKYSLASKFVATCNLEPKQVAGFLSDCVVSTLQSYHGTGDPRDSPRTRIFNPQMTSKQFMELAQLCPDHTLLGNNLLSTAKSLSTTEQPTTNNLIIQIELLIRAHDCFTLGCCVDGIAEVLTVSQRWVKERLIGGKHFKLMVRLLTGIGRFHEMSYIIGLLLKHDEFESLVHTGVEKEEQLRVALMEYLKRHHTGDTEKRQMVSLKFGMFRELARAQEEQAKRDMRKIRSKLLVANNAETVKNLKNVFDGFRAAAKTYSQEDCLSSAERCYSKARLVALQLSLLQNGKQVINLDAKQVRKFMEEHPFSEALIVSDAYKHGAGVWADWISPLYKKVVITGDFRYLNDFKTAFPLTPNMFQELASKYLHDREKPPEATNNIKRLLTYLKNLPLKRKIGMELGLTEVVQSIGATFDESFLNDVARL